MKKLFSVFFISVLLTSYVFSQTKEITPPNVPVDEETKLITYKGVINEAGKKEELFDRGLVWFSKYFKNPTEVIREKDKENSKIKGIARFQIYSDENNVKVLKGNVEYTMILECKESRYRYTVSNFNLKQTSYFPLEKWLNKKDPAFSEKCNLYLSQLDTNINDMIKNLTEEMKPKVKKVDNW